MASWNNELEPVLDHFGEQMAPCGPVRKWRDTMHVRGINHVVTLDLADLGHFGDLPQGASVDSRHEGKAMENKNVQGPRPISGFAELVNCRLFQSRAVRR